MPSYIIYQMIYGLADSELMVLEKLAEMGPATAYDVYKKLREIPKEKRGRGTTKTSLYAAFRSLREKKFIYLVREEQLPGGAPRRYYYLTWLGFYSILLTLPKEKNSEAIEKSDVLMPKLSKAWKKITKGQKKIFVFLLIDSLEEAFEGVIDNLKIEKEEDLDKVLEIKEDEIIEEFVSVFLRSHIGWGEHLYEIDNKEFSIKTKDAFQAFFEGIQDTSIESCVYEDVACYLYKHLEEINGIIKEYIDSRKGAFPEIICKNEEEEDGG